MKYLVLLFILTNIFGDDILTSYRLNGITDIEKQMDKELCFDMDLRLVR